ncbi:MAG TPA: hypothetical protein ENJ54_00995 [Chloroflexi bacterium]|nr:hypothetical protein [Chloroflexota bacterium]
MAEEREQYVTVRMTARGREKLRRLAKLNRRTMAQQLEWLIDREWREMKEGGGRRDVPRVTEDGSVVYRAPYTTETVVVPADEVEALADGRPLDEGVLWEIVKKARGKGALAVR